MGKMGDSVLLDFPMSVDSGRLLIKLIWLMFQKAMLEPGVSLTAGVWQIVGLIVVRLIGLDVEGTRV